MLGVLSHAFQTTYSKVAAHNALDTQTPIFMGQPYGCIFSIEVRSVFAGDSSLYRIDKTINKTHTQIFYFIYIFHLRNYLPHQLLYLWNKCSSPFLYIYIQFSDFLYHFIRIDLEHKIWCIQANSYGTR